MRRPVGGDATVEKYLLAVDQAVEGGVSSGETTLPKPVGAWTGGAWTWVWQLSRDPVAELIASARPYFFPSGTNDAEFRELRVDLAARVWLPQQRETVSTLSYYAERLSSEAIEQSKSEDLVSPLVHAIIAAAPDLKKRAEEFGEAQRNRINWLERFNAEVRAQGS